MRKAHLLGAIVASFFSFLSQIAPIYGDVITEGQVSPLQTCISDLFITCAGTIGPTNLSVGFLDDGVVTVTDDGGPTHLITVPLTRIGESAEGTLNLIGRETTWTAIDSVDVGRQPGSSGIVSVSRAAVWNSENVIIGNAPGSNGIVMIHEPGTLGDPIPPRDGSGGGLDNPDLGPTWNNTGFLLVGLGGNGTLDISDGDVTVDSLAVGFGEGGTGVVTIYSRFANVVSNQGVLVGAGGNGTLNVISSTLITNPEPQQFGLFPAHNMIASSSAETGSGTIKVDGTGSLWTAHGSDARPTILVGGGDGTGELIVSNGAVVETVADTSNPTYIEVASNGTLSGNGTIISDVVVSGGTVAPGLSPGTLTIDGDYTHGVGSELLIEIAGINPGEFDVLNVLGTAIFEPGSTIKLDFTNGFTPSTGDQFDFLQAAALVGNMSLVDYIVLGLDPGFEFDAGLTDIGTFGITVLNDGMSAVPIPSAVWLFGSGLLGMIGIARRKKTA